MVLGEAGEDQIEVLVEVFVEVQNQVAVEQMVHLTAEQVEV